MPKDHNEFGELHDLWKSQKDEEMLVSIETIKEQATKFETQIRIRNIIEAVAAIAVVAIFGRMAITATTLLSLLGAIATAAAALYITWRLYKSGSAAAPSPASSTREYVLEHRAELENQARLLKQAPYWYVAPLALGLGLISVDRILVLISKQSPIWPGILTLAISMGVCGLVALLNVRASRKLQARADGLPLFKSE